MDCGRPVAGFIGFLFLAAMASGCAVNLDAGGAEGDFDRTLTVSGPADVSIRSGAGSVDVEAGTDNVVRIHGHVRTGMHWWFEGDAVDHVKQIVDAPPIEQNGNVINIGRGDGDPRYQNAAISYVITVPVATRVESRVGSGAQTIARVDGPVEASTGSGAITVDTVRGDIKATTGSGAIHIQGAMSELEARTGSGSIHVDGEPHRPWNLRTGSGGIDVRVDNQTAFNVDAQAGSGGIDVAQLVAAPGRQERQHVLGSVRGGGAVLQMRTGSGGIHVE